MSSSARRLAAALIVVAGRIHLVLAPEYLEEETYVGVLFLVSVPLTAWVAYRLFRGADRNAALVGIAVAAGMAVGFVLSRTVGLPGFKEEEWELAGIVSVVVEAGFIALTGPFL